MTNQIINFYKENRKDFLTGGLFGTAAYLVSIRMIPQESSILQSSFSETIVAVNPEIKMLMFFIVLGIAFTLVISGVMKK